MGMAEVNESASSFISLGSVKLSEGLAEVLR